MSNGTVIQEDQDGVHIVSFRAEDNPELAHEVISHFFSEVFLGATKELTTILVDLGNVPALDSSSLGPLVQKLRDTQDRGGAMALCNVESPGLREIFSLTRFDKIFPIHADRQTALAALKS